MTREVAIDRLRKISEKTPIRTNGDDLLAITMAIQALSQEPCDDAISRMSVLKVLTDTELCNEPMPKAKLRVIDLPSVTQKSGKWTNKDVRKEEYVLTGKCSVCGQVRVKDKFCSNCGCRMVEPQESEDKE